MYILMNASKGSVKMKKCLHQVIKSRKLTDLTFVLQLERCGLVFEPGQHLNIGLPDDGQQREYSVYSSVHDDVLEILVQTMPTGHVSSRLSQLSQGDAVLVNGPHGRFTLEQAAVDTRPFFLIATGSGIAPFHCFARSFDQLDYHILHGVRGPEGRHEHTAYPQGRYTACVSQSRQGGFRGRVTDYLKTHPADLRAHYYLCGNSDMIYDVFSLLMQQGMRREQIFTEVYF
jgi:ferredoxin--NADP+ reductase